MVLLHYSLEFLFENAGVVRVFDTLRVKAHQSGVTVFVTRNYTVSLLAQSSCTLQNLNLAILLLFGYAHCRLQLPQRQFLC